MSAEKCSTSVGNFFGRFPIFSLVSYSQQLSNLKRPNFSRLESRYYRTLKTPKSSLNAFNCPIGHDRFDGRNGLQQSQATCTTRKQERMDFTNFLWACFSLEIVLPDQKKVYNVTFPPDPRLSTWSACPMPE